MTITAIDVTTIEPLAHDEAMRRQAQELERTLALLRSLDDAAWTAPTACPAWDIRAMYQHVLGACEAGASIRENVRQLRRARSHRNQNGGPLEAALSAVQVRERAGLSPAGYPAGLSRFRRDLGAYAHACTRPARSLAGNARRPPCCQRTRAVLSRWGTRTRT